MQIIRFYGHFAAAFGSLWLCMFVLSGIMSSHINIGGLGLFGMFGVSAVYAYLRVKENPTLTEFIDKSGRRIDDLTRKNAKSGADLK